MVSNLFRNQIKNLFLSNSGDGGAPIFLNKALIGIYSATETGADRNRYQLLRRIEEPLQ